jgi:hypothetical protein
MNIKKLYLAVVIFLIAPSVDSSAQYTAQTLLSQGPKKNIQVAPDGKRIAFLSLENGIYQVFKEHINGGEILQLSSVKGADVSQVEWVDDETVVFLHETEKNGVDMLYSVNLIDAVPRLITPSGRDVNILGLDKRNNTVIFELRSEAGVGYELCSFNKKYKTYQTLHKNEGDVTLWGVTSSGQLNCWVEQSAGGTRLIGAMGSANSKLYVSDSPHFLKPLAPSTVKKGGYTFLTDQKHKGLHIIGYDLTTGEKFDDIISPEGTTIHEYSIANTDGRVLEIGVRNLKDGSIEYQQTDQGFSQIVKDVASRSGLPGRIKFSNTDAIENVWIFEVIDDYGRINIIRYNKANKEVKILAGDIPIDKKEETAAPAFSSASNGKTVTSAPLRRDSRNPLFDLDASQFAIPQKSIMTSDFGYPIPVEVYSPAEITSQTYYVLHIHFSPLSNGSFFNGYAQYLVANGLGYIDFNLCSYPSQSMREGAETWLKLVSTDISAMENWFAQLGLAKQNRILLFAEGIGSFPALESLLTGKFKCNQIALYNPLTDMNSLKTHFSYIPQILESAMTRSGAKAFQPLSFGSASHLNTDIAIFSNEQGDGFISKQANTLAENLSNNSIKTISNAISDGTFHTPSEKGQASLAEELLTFFIKSVKNANDSPAQLPTRK